MPGRHARPVQLHLLQGNPSRLTKAEIAQRQESEIRFGSQEFKATMRIRKDKIAKAKWKEVVGLYLDYGVEFVSTSDAAIIERYCLTYSEYMKLVDVRAEIEAVALRKGADVVSTYKTQDMLGIDNALNKKSDMLTKLEDRLFLNPLAKLKNVPKQEKAEDQPEPMKAMFGD